MNEEEVKEEVKNKNKSKLIIIILAILVLLLIGVLVYVLLLRKQEEPVNNNSQQNTNETVKLDANKASKEIINLISDFGGVMPLKAKGDKPSSYTIKDLTKEINSDIILSYALQNISEKDNNICKYDDKYNSVCHIKVSELNTKLGLNIDNNIKTTNYVLGVVKKDNDDYYKVIFPATEWSQEYYVRDCTTTHTDETLTIKCDVYEVIEMYDPYEEAKIGIGEFIYNIKDKLAFENFKFTATSTSTTKKDDKKTSEETGQQNNNETKKTGSLDEYISDVKNEANKVGATVTHEILSNDSLPKELTVDSIGPYKINLTTNGKVTISSGENEAKELSNIADAKNIYCFALGNRLYILLSNGDVYQYILDDYDAQKYVATKVDTIKGATNFVIISIVYKNAGADTILGAIDSNNKYFRIDDIAI